MSDAAETTGITGSNVSTDRSVEVYNALRVLLGKLDPEDDPEAGESLITQAIRVVERVEELEAENHELRTRLQRLNERVDGLEAGIENDDYERLTREQKLQRVKRLAVNDARKKNGKGFVTYNEVISAFDKQMPNGTAYKLMQRAGADQGFLYDERDDAKNRLVVDLEKTEMGE